MEFLAGMANDKFEKRAISISGSIKLSKTHVKSPAVLTSDLPSMLNRVFLAIVFEASTFTFFKALPPTFFLGKLLDFLAVCFVLAIAVIKARL